MSSPASSVIIVDGYSTGSFYAAQLKERGVPALHVRSFSDDIGSHLREAAAEALERTGQFYAALFNGFGDLDALCRELGAHNPCAVLAGCETGVPLADELAHRLGLPGNDLSLSAARRDKFLMHAAVRRAGLRALDSVMSDDLDEILALVQRRGLPIVLKPAQSSGADGVHICRSEDDVRHAFGTLLGAATFCGGTISRVLAQEFAAGNEVVVNTVSLGGEHMVSDLWRYTKLITSDGRSIYDSTELAADFGDITDEVLDYALKVLDALGIAFGPAHMEIMLTAEGPVLIECGARPMGGSFPQHLFKECFGRTQLELSLDAALTPERFPALRREPYAIRKHFCAKCLISDRAGELDAIPGISLLTALPSARSGNFLACLGSFEVPRTVDLFSSPALLYLCHEDADVLRADHDLVRALERDGQNLLFEAAPQCGLSCTPEWMTRIPDEMWLKPVEVAEADGDILWQALELAPGLDVLDCPCGDGRVCAVLARRGAFITGVDINERFVVGAGERFAREGLAGEFSTGDMRELAFDNRFDAVLNWFNSFGYFDVETDFRTLRNFARALKPGGLLILEAPNREGIIANIHSKTDAKGQVLTPTWDELTERLYLPMDLGGGEDPEIVSIGARMYSLAQFKLLFQLAGLRFESVHGEDFGEFGAGSKRMIMLARKPS